VRNDEECVCSPLLFLCNIVISDKIIKEMPGSVASGTPCRTINMQLFFVNQFKINWAFPISNLELSLFTFDVPILQ
jgi:hypothetical protein